MLLVVEGRVSVSRAAARRSSGRGRRASAPARCSARSPLIDGGRHSATATVAETTTLLTLSRAGFRGARVAPAPDGVRAQAPHRRRGLRPAARPARRRSRPRWAASRTRRRRRRRSPRTSSAGRRTASTCAGSPTFHDFDSLALWGFLTAGRYAFLPPGRTLIAEGTPSSACFVMINGAVEKVIIRGDRRIRVGLAGPGPGVRLRDA